VLVREVRERRGEAEKSGQIEPTSTDISMKHSAIAPKPIICLGHDHDEISTN
jgi:hypothetical protein